METGPGALARHPSPSLPECDRCSWRVLPGDSLPLRKGVGHGVPLFLLRRYKMMQMSPPLPSLMILVSVSCSFFCALSGMRASLL